ncbi:tether containing UBX domain for GLUT4 [Anoplophora glabripennis]|uniref:tether containing UBX domain for GLUT4 n=1 Tax=Anoplophora glabripennis TaxID=217634 RepID=UPI0008740C28|nr:tether containing UBX domain for GLUT4 [Anoplophora glabripennis]
MSGGTVCVLALNGRRQTVKCTPNTTILQILEDVCRKQGLQPEEYDLKHHSKVLDTTTTFRFSGLPNNAQLELVPALKIRNESDVILAVNLENGSRLIGNFSPNDTLLNVLNKLCPENIRQDTNPVVVYTRREIYGKELENVTLRSLGLTGGRAMIRLMHRSPEDLKTQANISAPLPSKPVEEKPYVRKLQRVPTPPRVEEKIPETKNNNETEDKKEETEEFQKPQLFQKNHNVDLLKLAREKRKSNDSSPLKTEEKRKTIERHTNLEEQKLTKEICECRRDESMEVDCCGKCQEKCTNITESIEDEFVFLGDRNAMLFSLETAQAVPSEDLPDDFFDLTIDDARKILRDVKKQKLGTDNAPLMTSALRNLEESKKQLRQLNKYKKAVIRVQFPDRTVLQGTFAPVDTIGDVVKFVKEYLEDKSLNFYVYCTPPKCILDENKRLIELGFVPGAMVHFGTHSANSKTNYLRKDLQNKFTSNSVASLAAAKMRSQNTRCLAYETEDFEIDESTSNDTNVGASTSSGITHENYTERKIIKSTEKVPKWFKP